MTLSPRQSDALLALALIERRREAPTSSHVAEVMPPWLDHKSRPQATRRQTAQGCLSALAARGMVEAVPKMEASIHAPVRWRLTEGGRAAVRREAERRTPEVTA